MELVGRGLAFCVLAATAAHAGWRLAGATMRAASLAERLLGTGVFAVAFISLLVLALGHAGALLLPVALTAQVAAWTALVWITREQRAPVSTASLATSILLKSGSRSVGAAVWVAAAVLASTAWVGLLRPHYDYDTLTNHLFVPARWIQAGKIALVDTPFGAPTAAYEPMTTELLYAWLMLPFHADLLARFGQALHLAVLYLALYAIGRRLGLPRAAGALGPLALHVSKPLVAQAAGAMTDLALAAWWMTAVALALRWRELRDTSSASLVALAIGLYAGTKYVAVAYLPLLVAVVLALRFLHVPHDARASEGVPRSRWTVIATCAAALCLGGFWYARNLLATANPLFPVRVELGGREIFSGAFGPAQLEAWVFNRRVPGLAWRHFLEQLGESLGRGAPGAWYALPIIPLAAFAAACVIASRRSQAARAPSLVVLLSAVAAVAIAWLVLPSHAPRFVFASLATWAIGVAIVAARGRVAAAFVLIALAAHALLSSAYYIYTRPSPLRARAFLEWGAVGAGWAWVDEHLRGARIAYAGHNLPYFLLGPRFENEVFYVDTEARGGSYHDYFLRFGPEYAEPFTPEPAYYRMEESESAWLDHLAAARAEYLFVAALPWNERVNHRHSRDGFVIEETWASGQPERFRLLFENPAVRLFAIDPAGAVRAASAPVRRGEVDALELYLDRPEQLDRFYPGARAFIEKNRVADYARSRRSAR